jgi:hypothetical protein
MTTSNNANKLDDELYAKLNRETAQIPWHELLRHFASGTVIAVSDELDLIDVAARISNDDKASVAHWMEQGQVAKVSDDQARIWLEQDAALWTVVVRPWILVQYKKPLSA